MTVFNQHNSNHITKTSQVFLGEEMGLFDTINVKHPKLESLFQEQMGQMWNEFEVDLHQDKMDMMTTKKEVTELMVETISWQFLVDGVASKSISTLLMNYVTNTEAFSMFSAQALFECIHSRTYSHIIKQTFEFPEEMIDRVYGDVHALIRSSVIIEIFDELEARLTGQVEYDEYATRKILVKSIVALFCLESISFMASFAVTFGITKTGVFQGIGNLVSLICRDELLHSTMDYEVIKILMNDPRWAPVFVDCRDDIEKILNATTSKEIDQAKYLFRNGSPIPFIGEKSLCEYVSYVSDPLYTFFRFENPHGKVKENPLPYMDQYVSGRSFQDAAMEINKINYNIGLIVDDLDKTVIDFSFD